MRLNVPGDLQIFGFLAGPSSGRLPGGLAHLAVWLTFGMHAARRRFPHGPIRSRNKPEGMQARRNAGTK